MVAFDTMIFLLTLFKTLKQRSNLPGGVIEIIFRDGMLTFKSIIGGNNEWYRYYRRDILRVSPPFLVLDYL